MKKPFLLVISLFLVMPCLGMIEDTTYNLPHPTNELTIRFINQSGSSDVLDNWIERNGAISVEQLNDMLRHSANRGMNGSVQLLLNRGATEIGQALLAAAQGVQLGTIKLLLPKITNNNLHLLLPVWLKLKEQQEYAKTQKNRFKEEQSKIKEEILRLKNRETTLYNKSISWAITPEDIPQKKQGDQTIKELQNEKALKESILNDITRKINWYDSKEVDALLSLVEIVDRVGTLRSQNNLNHSQVQRILENAAPAA